MKMNSSEKHKLCIIVVGCGYFGLKRIQACSELKKEIEISGVVDVDIGKAKETAELFHVPYAKSLSEITKKIAVDAAIIAVPNVYHAPLIAEALKNNLHVLCEKPLAINMKEVNKIVNISKRYNLLIKTGSNHRFFPTIIKASELINAHAIGKILVFKGSIGNNGDHAANSWFWNKKISGGGTFIDNGCHLLDLARMFMGDFDSCISSISNLYWNKANVEDAGTALYKTKDGRQAIISASWIQWGGYMYIELWGTDGYIIIDSKKGDTIVYGNKKNSQQKIFDLSQTAINSYHKEILYFKECITSKISPNPGVDDGVQVVKMIEAAYRSSKTKKSITL